MTIETKYKEEIKMMNLSIAEMWERLEEMGVSEQTLQIVTDINGYNEETLLDVLYAFSGYRNFEQLED